MIITDEYTGSETVQYSGAADVVGLVRVRVAARRPQDGATVWHYYGIPREVLDEHKALLLALRTASYALQDCAEIAGDVPYWNEGGYGYDAARLVRDVLEKYSKR